MGRRRGEEETRRNRTRRYDNRERGGERGGERDWSGLGGPGRGDREYPYDRYYDEYGDERYRDDREYRFYRDEYERRRSTKNTAIKWAGIVGVALVACVSLVLITGNLTDGPSDSAQQPVAPQQPAPQQPVQPEAPQQPQTPSAPGESPASQEDIDNLRERVDQQIQAIQERIDGLYQYIADWFRSTEQQENSQ